MDGEFSPAVQRALAMARSAASARGAACIEPGDLLAAVLADPENSAGALLQRHGLDGSLLGAGAALVARAAAANGEPAGAAAFSAAASAALHRARQLAVTYSRQDEAGSAELVVALLEAGPAAIPALAAHREVCRQLIDEYHRQRAPRPIPVDVRLDLAEPAEPHAVDVARIVDAAANRLSEALRVIEDYARFVLDERLLCARLKDCRHRLAGTLERFPDLVRLAARETEQDVGTTISTPAEHVRQNLAAVVAANCKRAQEAARSLEEFAKLHDPAAAQTLEAIRYDLYSIERLLYVGGRARLRLERVRLYWLLDPDACCKSLDWMVAEAVAGGVDGIQLRDKTGSDRERLALARDLRRRTIEQEVLFIVNDRPDVARLANADGVHVGQDDCTVRDARRIVGPEALVGVSTHDLDQVHRALWDGADYIGVGPVFPSQTKDFDTLAGLEFVRQAHAEVTLPAFCIGGIGPENVPEVVAAGGRRIAVSHCLCRAPEPRAIARQLRQWLTSTTTVRDS